MSVGNAQTFSTLYLLCKLNLLPKYAELEEFLRIKLTLFGRIGFGSYLVNSYGLVHES